MVLEKTLESPLDCKEIQPVNPKGNQSWIFIWRTDVDSEAPILWPPDVKNWLIRRPWCWPRLKAGGVGDDRGLGGWMTSPTRWTWVWASSGSCWWTGKSGALQSLGLQRVRHDWVTELNWIEPDGYKEYIYVRKTGKIKKKNLPSQHPLFKGIFVFSSLEDILLKDKKHSEHCSGPHTWWFIQPQWVYFSSQSLTWGWAGPCQSGPMRC